MQRFERIINAHNFTLHNYVRFLLLNNNHNSNNGREHLIKFLKFEFNLV